MYNYVSHLLRAVLLVQTSSPIEIRPSAWKKEAKVENDFVNTYLGVASRFSLV